MTGLRRQSIAWRSIVTKCSKQHRSLREEALRQRRSSSTNVSSPKIPKDARTFLKIGDLYLKLEQYARP